MKRFYAVFLSVFVSICATAQEAVWNLDFDVRAYNFEYEKMPVGTSKTLFGLYLAPTIGFGWGENSLHSVNVGADILTNFGNQGEDRYKGTFLAYYRLNGENHKVMAGIFPAGDAYDDYPTALISDEKRFMDRSIEGVKYLYTCESGYFKAMLDVPLWQDNYMSEIITLYMSTQWKISGLRLGLFFDMNHYAYDIASKLVIDNIWINPYIGYDISDITGFQRLELGLSGIFTGQRDRVYEDEFSFPMGGEMVFAIQRWNVGIENRLYYGDNLMPNYGYPGLYHGSEMYRLSSDEGLFNRLECYYNAYSNSFIDVRLSFVMNAFGTGEIGWQQNAALIISLDQMKWKNLRKCK